MVFGVVVECLKAQYLLVVFLAGLFVQLDLLHVFGGGHAHHVHIELGGVHEFGTLVSQGLEVSISFHDWAQVYAFAINKQHKSVKLAE